MPKATRTVDPDGTVRWRVDPDALEAASLLEDTDIELTPEQFEQLTDEMRKAREEADAEESDDTPQV